LLLAFPNSTKVGQPFGGTLKYYAGLKPCPTTIEAFIERPIAAYFPPHPSPRIKSRAGPLQTHPLGWVPRERGLRLLPQHHFVWEDFEYIKNINVQNGAGSQ